jgi:DNA-binding transcriptional MocR family regulator
MVTDVRNAAELVADLESRIDSGSLKPGDRLAPVRSVAVDLGLAPNTVAGAYRVLRERGFTISRGRAGTFVADRPALGGVIADVIPEGLVDLANGHPDSSLLPDLTAALRSARYEPATYSTSPVDEELGELFRRDLAADGVDATHLAIVGGALDGLERVLAAHCRPGDTVAVEDPAYASVLDLLGAMALRAVPVAMDDEGPRPEALDKVLAAGCEAVVVTPRAQNPTGAAITTERSQSLRTMLERHPDVLVIEDDHAGAVAGVAHHSIVEPARSRWAVVRSVSKSLGPDLRLAAVTGDAVTISRVTGRQAAGTGWVSHVLQRLVVELRTTQPSVVQRAEHLYTHRRELFVRSLQARRVPTTSPSGLNVWVPVNDEVGVVMAMQQRGYALRAGARFRMEAPPGVRVTIASSDDTEIVAVAEALADVMLSGGPRRTA